MVVSILPVTVFATGTTYTITNGTAQDAHGSITVAETAASGTDVTVTVTADEGYALKTLKYNDGEDHTITVDKDGKYTFTMPASDVTVTAEFEAAAEKPVDETLYWGFNETTKAFYLSKTSAAITAKGATPNEFNSTQDYPWIGDSVLPWKGVHESVQSVEILNDIAPGSTANWFNDMKKLTEIKGIEHLDTSNVKSMFNMFLLCESLQSLDLSSFDTSNVADMKGMFSCCYALESLKLSGFDTSNVTNMYEMFQNCNALKSLDLKSFVTTNVTNMSLMFQGCKALESLDLRSFYTSNVTDMHGMFWECEALKTLDLSSFVTSNVEDMKDMFNGCKALKSLDLSSFDTSNVEDMTQMFYQCEALKTLTLSNNFKTSKVQKMGWMFLNCKALESLNLSSFDTSNVTQMAEMFTNCESLKSLYLSNFVTSNVLSMEGMFQNCRELKTLDISNLDTSKVTDMSCMFTGCNNLTSLDVSSFDTSSVQNMSTMFADCYALTSLDLSNFNTSNVTNMKWMFRDSIALKSLDLSSFDCTKVTNANMFFLNQMKGSNYAITQLKTPTYLKFDASLPKINSPWYDADSLTAYENDKLPKEKSESITLVAGTLVGDWGALQTAINGTAGNATTPATATTNFILKNDLTAPEQDGASITIPEGKDITIDLNGFTIDRGLSGKDAIANGNVITVKGTLTLNDSSSNKTGKITGGNNTNNGGGVRVEANAVFNMDGGSIEGNKTNYHGGGLLVATGAQVNIKDAKIAGNAAGSNYNGGGIFVYAVHDGSLDDNEKSGAVNGGTVVLTDTEVSGNSAWFGGGIFIKCGSVTAKNCLIKNNTAKSGGGGVEIEETVSSFTMNGGAITGNTVKEVDSSHHKGAGVHFNNGAFVVKGTVDITGNICPQGSTQESNVYLRKNPPVKFDIGEMATDSKIGVYAAVVEESGKPNSVMITSGGTQEQAACFSSDFDDYFVRHQSDHFELVKVAVVDNITNWTALKDAISGANGPTTIQLAKDLTAPATGTSITIPEGKDITLDLNGHVLNGDGKVGSVITVPSGANLTITDSSENKYTYFNYVKDGAWTLNTTADADAKAAAIEIADIDNETAAGTLIKLPGGAITGGSGYINGGGVCVSGTLNMYGGNIVGNTADYFKGPYGMGGGVNVSIDSTFTMTGGNIIGNAAKDGGGVYVKNGTFTMNGGEISGNTAFNHGGGVYDDGGVLTLGGTAQITGNTLSDGETANNLYLPLYDDDEDINTPYVQKTIALGTGGDAPKSGMSVGVTMASAPGAFTTNGTATDVKYFTSDSAEYFVNFNADHLELKVIPGVAKIGDTGYETLAAAVEAAKYGDEITLLKDAAVNAEGATSDSEKSYGIIIRKSITLNLNGKMLSSTKYMGVWVKAGNVTIMNGTITGSGTIALSVTNGANLTLDSVTVKYTGSKTEHRSLHATNSDSSLSIKGNTDLFGDFTIDSKNKTASVEAGTYNFNPTSYVNSDKFWVDNTSTPGYYVVKPVAVAPMAKTGLTENDEEQIGVAKGEGYTLSGTYKATAADEYTAYATPATGYVWSDGTTAKKEIKWSIAQSETVAKIGTTEYKTLAGALKAAQSGTGDGKTVTVVGAVNGFTFDGNYDSIIIKGSDTGKITGNFTAAEDASLKNVKFLNLKFEGCGIDFSNTGLQFENAVIQGCTFDGTGIPAEKRQQAITINVHHADKLQIDKNTIKNYTSADSSGGSSAILLGTVSGFDGFVEGHSVTISNNKIENIAYNAIQATDLAKLVISNNTISNAKKNKGPINLYNTKEAEISGNTITLAEGYAGVYYNINKGIVTLSNNTIKNSASETLTFSETLANVNNAYEGVTGTGVLVLKGAKEADDRYIAVSKDVITIPFPDKDLALVSGTYYTYALAVARIGDTTYASLADALASATDGNVVTLIKDITIAEQLNINKAITLNGNGNTITRTPNAGAAATRAGILVTAGATITDLIVSGPNTTASGWDSGEFGIKLFNATGATLDRVTVTGANAGIQVNGGSVTMKNNITVSDNEYGGIELCHGGKLDLSAATLVNSGETETAPTLWNDDTKGTITFNASQPFSKKIADENKDHYYLSSDKQMVSMGGQSYLSLADAIAEVQNNSTITLLNNNSETITVNKVIAFKINANSKAFTPGNIAAGTDYERIMSTDQNGVTTYKFRIPVTFDAQAKPVNGGNAITYGTTYTVTAPTVSDTNGALNPQPEMTFTYYESNGGDNWTKLNAKPTDAGSYKVVIAVKDDNATYTGSKEYAFDIAKADAEAPADGVGYTIDYAKETITPATGYEFSTANDFSTVLSTETDITFGTTYYVRKAADANHNASEGTRFSFTRPAAPAASAFTMTGETVENKKDGSFSGITAAMEYSTNNGTTWVPGPKTLTGLSNETVKVRYKATTAAFKSSEYSYTFTASTAKLTVSFGDNAESQQLAYGAKVDKPADPTKSGYTFGGWYSDEECTQAWNFAIDTVKDNMTLYPKWIRNAVQKAAISGSVKESSNGVSGATVELFLGTVKVAATVTNDSGNYSFDNVENGIYNIVVTKADGKTKTELVTVDSTGSFSANVELPTKAVSSKVEHKGNEVPNTKSDIKETVVGGLDAIAAEKAPTGGQTITIKLTVEPKAEDDVASASDIKALAGSGKKVEFLDLSLWEITTTTQGELKGDIGNANSALLTIVIPFDFSGVNVSSVTILRQHGTDSAEPLTKNPAAGQEGFTVNATEGTITIYAKKFSTYAMAYAEQSTGSHGGGSYTPGHTVTSDLKSVTKVTIDGKVVDSRYYTVSGGTVYLTGEFMKTLANGKHTVKLYDGLKVATGTITVTGNMNVISAPTGDAGLALYAALSVSSVLGMGWVGKKKRDEE